MTYAYESSDVVSQKPVDLIVGRRLSALRTARGLGLGRLSSVLETTTSVIEHYESGSVRIPPAHLIEICQFFQVELTDLFARLDRDHDPRLH